MRCPYCKKKVVGQKDVVIVIGEGPAHKDCYSNSQLHSSDLSFFKLESSSMEELAALQKAILNEIRFRNLQNVKAITSIMGSSAG